MLEEGGRVAKKKKLTDKRERVPATPSDLKVASDEQVAALARVCDSPEGKVLLKMLDTVIHNNLIDLQTQPYKDADQFIRVQSYKQGATAAMQRWKTIIEAAPAEVNRRE